LRYSIDPHTHMLRNNGSCKFIAYFCYYIPVMFYSVYLYQIQMRLELSFKGSFLELGPRTICTLKAFVLIIPIICYVFLAVDRYDLDCIGSWNAPDVDEPITFCVVPAPSLIAFKYHIFELLVLLILFLNAIFGIIFTKKLKQFCALELEDKQSQSKKQFRMMTLIIRNDICCVVGCISTTMGQVGWLFTGHMMFIYLDNFINCLVIGLMLYWNEKYYKVLCAPCIRGCFKCCGSSIEVIHLNEYIERTDVSTPGKSSNVSRSVNCHASTLALPSPTNTVHSDSVLSNSR